jgi:hypothetical protein
MLAQIITGAGEHTESDQSNKTSHVNYSLYESTAAKTLFYSQGNMAMS